MVQLMKSIYDVQQMLKRFGVFVYTGNRLSDLQLMELELKELFDYALITKNDYMLARLILEKEIKQMKQDQVQS